MTTWNCQLCSSGYITLPELVSHTRGTHSEEVGLNIVCQVNNCPKVFGNTSTWYKHVRKNHSDQYLQDVSASGPACTSDSMEDDSNNVLSCENDHSTMSSDQIDSIDIDNLSECKDDSDSDSSPYTFNSKDIAGKLLKLKEKHMLSHAAIDEVVELVKVVSDTTVTNALSEILLSAESDTTSNYFQHLPSVLENLSSPLASIGTIYKQQYIAKNLPYVVC